MYGLIALNFIIPFVMVFVGYILKKHPVKDMTSGNGYNTPTSRKSQEHWDYAQSIAPNIFIGIGKTLGLVEIVFYTDYRICRSSCWNYFSDFWIL